MAAIPTIAINRDGHCAVINKRDYDPEVHTLWDGPQTSTPEGAPVAWLIQTEVSGDKLYWDGDDWGDRDDAKRYSDDGAANGAIARTKVIQQNISRNEISPPVAIGVYE